MKIIFVAHQTKIRNYGVCNVEQNTSIKEKKFGIWRRNNMKKITGTKARDTICPFKFGTDWIYCDGLKCMAFKIIDRKYETKDQSDAREFLNRIKQEDNREEQKIIEVWQGGQKCLLLEERGYCTRLYKKGE